MNVKSDHIWFDGRMVPFAEANVHVLSHTLHYGLGVFEGIRAYEQPDGRPGIWRLGGHLRRFVESIRMMRYEPTYTVEQLTEACLDVLEANRFKSAYLRPIAFLGHGALGLGARSNPLHVAVAAWPWGAYLGEEGMARGIRMATSSFIRHHPNAALQRAKVVGHYVNNILARYEAAENGSDEALMLDFMGRVAEGTGENLFVVRDGVVATPPIVNILPGVTRQTVLEILDHEKIPVVIEHFGRDAIYTADECFVTGTAAEVTPVRELDRRTIGEGSPGRVTRHVQALYQAAVTGRLEWMRDEITTR